MAKKKRKKSKKTSTGSPSSKKKGRLDPALFDQENLKSLEQAVQKAEMDEDLQKRLLQLVEFVFVLRTAYDKKYAALLRVLRMIFGARSERRSKKKKSGGGGKGNGKTGSSEFTGAETVDCSHPTLKPGDVCPECQKGTLREGEPAKRTVFDGQAPIAVTIYLLQRLICKSCDAVFTTPPPPEAEEDPPERPGLPGDGEMARSSGQDPADHSTRSRRGGKERIWKPGIYATLVVFCYLNALPVYRLAMMLRACGIPLPESTIHKRLDEAFEVFLPVYRCLLHESVQADLYHIDDTGRSIGEAVALKKAGSQSGVGKISEVSLDQPCSGPVEGKKGKPREGTRTSCIVARLADGRETMLFRTDYLLAGECLDRLLEGRSRELAVPLLESDSLSHNQTLAEVRRSWCLDHLRRFFIDLESTAPELSGAVLDLLAQVYRNDTTARESGMDASERLVHHQRESGPVMTSLKCLLQVALTSAEPSSELRKPVKHTLDNWKQYTGFLRWEGVPLSNARCERVLKRVIAQRKVSMFFKTFLGAFRGDVFQSVLITAFEAKDVNHWHYVKSLMENRSKVIKNPETWLPHNYTLNFARS